MRSYLLERTERCEGVHLRGKAEDKWVSLINSPSLKAVFFVEKSQLVSVCFRPSKVSKPLVEFILINYARMKNK